MKRRSFMAGLVALFASPLFPQASLEPERSDAKTRLMSYRCGQRFGCLSFNDIRALEDIPPLDMLQARDEINKKIKELQQ